MKTLLFILATCLVAICDSQRHPPYYSLDDMPETSFDCRDKILGGYYADPETDCQMFHVCVKVPGVGVQNYRFLCPNGTAFDPESQICASWYDVDCEASLLYSGNFDLYRTGYVPSSPAIVASKATAIPLGPSTAAPARSRSPYNARQPQVDDEYYLQAGDSGDRRLQPKDVLRGSSSGNFFNQKKGREEEEEAVISKKKVAVRKFRKRPSQQAEDSGEAASTAAPTTYYSTAGVGSSRSTSGNTYLPRYNTIQRASQTQTPAPADAVLQTRRAGFQQRPSTAAPNSYQEQPRENYNTGADNYSYQLRQQQPNNYNYPSSTAAPRANNNYNYQAETRPTYNAPSSTPSTTAEKYNYQTVQRNSNAFPTTTIAPARNTYYNNNDNGKGNSDFAGSTAAPLSETTFYQQRNRNAQRYDTFAPVTTYAPNAYSTRNSSPNTEYDSNGNTVPQRFNTGRDTSRASTAAVTTAPPQAETYQRNNNNYNQRGSANTFTTTTPKPAYTYYDEYETKSTGSSEEYNNYNPNNYDYQRTNYNAAAPGTYTGNERANGESLKTAPSNNYGPSSFNSFANSNSAKPTAAASSSNDQNQYNYNAGSGNAEQYNNRESSFYTAKQESYNAANATSQQAARSSYYSGDVTSRPTTNQQPSGFSIKQQPRTTDDGSNSYDTSNTYRTTSRPRSSYSTNQAASTSVTSNSRSSYYTQTTAVNTVTTQRPQYTQAAVQKQYTDAARNQSPTFKGTKPPTAVNNTASAVNKTVTKTGDVAYDYAYYDEGAPSEYDGLDPISDRHFGKNAESLKVSRRASK